MKAKRKDSSEVFSLRMRMVLGGICIFSAALIIAGAWSIPFLFESPSILYKFGINKTFLRIGKILGVTAAVLIFFQVLLVSRVKILDRIFSLNRMYAFHRLNGIVIVILSLLHPTLILVAENFTLFTFEKRYWPEFLGIGVFIFILVLVTTAGWRLMFGFAYNQWRRFHRVGGLLVTALVIVHILFVSETFKSGLPRSLVFMAASINFLLLLRLWYRRFFPGKRRFVVSGVKPVGRKAYAVDVRNCNGQILGYVPGQFAFITPVSAEVPKEEHPFTIASTPSRPETLQFIIRSLGDWTDQIGRLKNGELVVVDGPYGLFSHMALPEKEPTVMIAGGIGVTPMLSMIRYMADMDDKRHILLIWSNRTTSHIVFSDEFKKLEHRLQNLNIIHVITRDGEDGIEKGRLDQSKLERMLDGWPRKSAVFICGPVEMMKETDRALKKIGFSSARVYKEEFKL